MNSADFNVPVMLTVTPKIETQDIHIQPTVRVTPKAEVPAVIVNLPEVTIKRDIPLPPPKTEEQK